MIYVDSNVPMYLIGATHPNKQRVIELVSQLLSARETLVTSAEVFQEILHRYLYRRDQKNLNAAYEALVAMVTRTAEVTKEDVDQARTAAAQYQSLSSRDCLHLSVMRRIGCPKIWSFDAGFDEVPSLQRVH